MKQYTFQCLECYQCVKGYVKGYWDFFPGFEMEFSMLLKIRFPEEVGITVYNRISASFMHIMLSKHVQKLKFSAFPPHTGENQK